MTASTPGSPAGIPPADVEITEEQVFDLLRTQHPDLADLGLSRHGSGWDNVTYRLGTELAVRLPRRRVAVELIENEQRWLPLLAPRVDVRIPAPVRVGVAGSGYPWPWSIVQWADGRPADTEPLLPSEAGRFGVFLHALHQRGPVAAPRNRYRGVPLQTRSASVESRIHRLAADRLSVPIDRVREVWQRAKGTALDTPEVWLHGDLHPRNVIVSQGRLAAVVDWGDMCVGDPATDLAAAWMLFPVAAHNDIRRGYGPISEATWCRARGWAVFFGVVLTDSGAGHDEGSAKTGRQILERACG